MSPDLALTVAGPDDPRWPAVAGLLRESFAYMAEVLGHPARATMLSPDDLARAATRGRVFLIVAGERPVACLFTRASRDFPDALYCGWLATAEDHRGRGLARWLLDAAEEEAAAQGLRTLTLDTGTAFTQLHQAFTRLGFHAVTTRDDVTSFRKSLPRRMAPEEDFTALHALLLGSFAYMEGRIDPPSSLTRMTPATLASDAADREIWVIDEPARPIACVILTPNPTTLYLGKLAVAPSHRGSGFARRLIGLAEARAHALDLPSITLQTRIELVENHAAFRALGFDETGKTAHPGFDRPTSVTFTRTL